MEKQQRAWEPGRALGHPADLRSSRRSPTSRESALPTHYEVLGVAPDASREQIRRAYVDLAKSCHPDRHQHDDPARRRAADERMKAATQAWHVLRDEGRREEYDLNVRGAASRAARPSTSGSYGSSRPGPRARPDPYVPPTSPSGIVVPSQYAWLYRVVPVVVVLGVLVGLLVVSAYASKGTSTGSSSAPTSTIPAVGDCVLVAALDTGRTPVPVNCGVQGAGQVASIVATPQPCPPDTVSLPLSDDKTTLCLRSPR